MTTPTPEQVQSTDLAQAIVANVLSPNEYEVVRHLGQVLGINATSAVLLIAEDGKQTRQVLQDTFGCDITVHNGDLATLAYASQSFDAVLVAISLSKGFHALARELSRVLKPNGTLGLVAFSVYRDQMPEDTLITQTPLIATGRPAAAYRAVLAECGFTAFVSEDRRSDLRQAALANYRQYMLHDESATQTTSAMSQALGLIAAGGVSVTLITAEKGL